MDSLAWDNVIEIYEKWSNEQSTEAEFASGMIRIVNQLRSDVELSELRINLVKNLLCLGLETIPDNVPPGFPTGISVYWIPTDHYKISIGLHDALIIPANKALQVIKMQLGRVRKLVGELNLSDEELNIWKAHYYQRGTRESVEFLYAQQPYDWLLTNLYLDISTHSNNLLRVVNKYEHNLQLGQISEVEARKNLETDIRNIRQYILDALEVAEELDVKQRSEEFLRMLD